MKPRLMMLLSKILLALGAIAGCTDVTIGEFSTAPKCSSYEEYSRYAESIDGFIRDDAAAASADRLLLKALKDCNVPVAPKSEVASKAKVFRHAKELMDKIVVLDTHCDFPEMRFDRKPGHQDLSESQSESQVTFEKMRQGHMNSIYMAFWMRPLYGNPLDEKGIAEAPAVLWKFIDETESHFRKFPELCGIARSREDAERLHKEGKVAFFYGLENAYWIGRNLSNLQKLKDRGITCITLCHWGDNIVCHSSNKSENPALGLTDFGRKVVSEMNRLGIVVDLSHTSRGTWKEVIGSSPVPVVFTHSGAAALYDYPRNVDDATLKALAANGGVIQIYLVQSFMAPGRNADSVGMKEMLQHLVHAIEVAGIDHVGIGLDFEGGGGGVGLNGANDAINLTMALLERGYSDEDIAKIWGGNYLRVLQEVQDYASRQAK